MSQSPKPEPALTAQTPPIGSSPEVDADAPAQELPLPPKRKGGRKPIYATSEERKQRNRQAQAAFRERRTEYIKHLEFTIKQNEETMQSLRENQREATNECHLLRYKTSQLETLLHENGIDFEAELQARTNRSLLGHSSSVSEPVNMHTSQQTQSHRNGHHPGKHSLSGQFQKPNAKVRTSVPRPFTNASEQSPNPSVVSPSQFSFPPLSPQLSSPVGYVSKGTVDPSNGQLQSPQGVPLPPFSNHQAETFPVSIGSSFSPANGSINYGYPVRTASNMLVGNVTGRGPYFSSTSHQDMEHLGNTVTERRPQSDTTGPRDSANPSRIRFHGPRPHNSHQRHWSLPFSDIPSQQAKREHESIRPGIGVEDHAPLYEEGYEEYSHAELVHAVRNSPQSDEFANRFAFDQTSSR